MPKPENIGEMGELLSISKSRVLRMIIAIHKEHLQGEVNKFVRAQNLIEAYAASRCLIDIDKFMGLIEQRIEQLKKGEG